MIKNFVVLIFILLLLGTFFMLLQRYGINNLPGNYNFKFGRTHVTVPILSCVVLSLVLSIFLRFMRRF